MSVHKRKRQDRDVQEHDCDSNDEADEDNISHYRSVKHVTDAAVREGKRSKRCQVACRVEEYLKEFPTEHSGLDSQTQFSNIPYESWNDNSDNGLVGKFLHWLAEHATHIYNPKKKLKLTLAFSLHPHLKNKYVAYTRPGKYIHTFL